MFRHPQSAMDVDIMVKEIRNGPQGAFDLAIFCTCSRKRDGTNSRGEFVIDPMIELAQQHLLVRA
jgi:hypothetical protein